MSNFLSRALDALPSVATSGPALVAYVVVVLSWTALAWRVARHERLLHRLHQLPERDRLTALELEMGEVRVPSGLSPDQWLRARVHRLLFGGLVVVCIAVVLIVAMASTKQLPNGDVPLLNHQRQVQEYQRQVRVVCAEDREAELGFKRRTEEIQEKLMAGDLTALASVVSAMTDTIIKEQGLAGRLGAPDPPPGLEAMQSEAVATWNRKLAVSRDIRDQLAHSASDPVGLAKVMQHLNASQESLLESEKDDLLRRLGGPGCDPSP